MPTKAVRVSRKAPRPVRRNHKRPLSLRTSMRLAHCGANASVPMASIPKKKMPTRPWEAGSAPLQVWNGWQAAETYKGYWGLPMVEGVVKVLPQEQVTCTSL